MKVLYDYKIFSNQRYGGVSRYFYELIKNIFDINDEKIEKIFLFQGFHLCDYDLSFLKNDKLNYFGIKRPRIKKTNRIFRTINNIFFKYYIKKNNLELKNNVIYHPTYYNFYELRFIKKLRVVQTVYDMTYERFPKLFNKAYIVINEKKISIDRADHIICISNFTKQDLVEITNINPGKIDVIYLATNLNKIPKELLVNVDKFKPYILYVGDRHSYKNFKIVLDCFISKKLYKDFNLVCFGGNNFMPKEIEIINEHSYIKNKIFQISGNDNLLASFYRNAFSLIYPSKYEGFGLPVLEALSLGCPVICSNSSSLPEVAGEAALYFNPLDEDGLLKNIEILNNKNIRKNVIINGFEQSKKFSWEKTAKETIEVYKKMS
jgi:glycosyltransferase involved in cell wall biosynthesis